MPVPSGSILRRQLAGFVGFSNLPSQYHSRSMRDGFTFTLMLVGEPGLGKSTLINSLFNSVLIPKKPSEMATDLQRSLVIRQMSADFEESGIRLKLNVIDTPGFGDFINNDESWQPIIQNIEARFDDYMEQEQILQRSKIVDSRVHACMYFIPATCYVLRQIDIETMRSLGKRANLIPVIAKSDLLSHEELKAFKERILEDIKHNEIHMFVPPTYPDDDNEAVNENTATVSKIPFAVIGAMQEQVGKEGQKFRGRTYPWGAIELVNEAHSDFVKLRQMLIRTHLCELRHQTHAVFYEDYRTEKLKSMGREQEVFIKEFNMIEAYEKQRQYDEERLQKMEADMLAVFQLKVKEKETKLKQSEDELHARHREMRDALERQRAELEERKRKLETVLQQLGTKSLTPEKSRKKGYFK